MNKKVIVIGSNSFSGSHFVDRVLKENMTVVGVSRSAEPDPVFLPYRWSEKQVTKFTFFQCDVNRDEDEIIRIIFDFRPDYIVNFAAQGMVAESWINPCHWFLTNTLAVVKLHHKLQQYTFLKKYVHISTPEVYGSCEGQIKESTLYNPSTPYAVSKAAADMSLMASFNAYDFPVVFIRSANVYGPGQQLYRIIPKAILFFLMGNTIELHGGGGSVRSFIHISDVADGIFRAMRNSRSGRIYHFATPDALAIRTLVKMVAKKTGVVFEEVVKDSGDRIGKDQAYLLDCTRAKQELEWKPAISLKTGLKDTIAWIKDNMEVLKNKSFDYTHKP